jgi:hypothetical protein
MRLLFGILCFILATQPVFAQKAKSKKEAKDVKDTANIAKNIEKEETKIKVSGVLEAGFDINNKVNKSETEYNRIGYGQIEISATPVKKVKAEFGLEYKDKDSALTIDKLYGQYNITDFGRVRVGYMKKSFGLEERAGVEERYFHKRSIINDGLEDSEFLGHDLSLQYRYDLNKTWFVTGGFSWIDETLFHQNYSVEYRTENTNLILAAIIGHYTDPEYDMTSFTTSLSFKHSAKLCVSEAEFTFGNNPAPKWAVPLGTEDFFVLGARLQEYFPIAINTKVLRQVIPVAEAALYSEELENKDFDVQLRAGLTLGFAKNSAFQWRNTYGTVLRTEDGERELRRRRFDSEVVVIF